MNAPIKIETIEPAANIANKIKPIILTIKLNYKTNDKILKYISII